MSPASLLPTAGIIFSGLCATDLNQHPGDTDALKNPEDFTFLNNPWCLCSADRSDSPAPLCMLTLLLHDSLLFK